MTRRIPTRTPTPTPTPTRKMRPPPRPKRNKKFFMPSRVLDLVTPPLMMMMLQRRTTNLTPTLIPTKKMIARQ